MSSGFQAPLWDTTNNLDGTNSGGRFTVVFDMTSRPRITELANTVFGDGKDTTPPVLSGVPAAMTVQATNPAGAAVTYAAPTATDNLDGARPVTCTPPSGNHFPMGLTTVACTARDNSGNGAVGTFTVTVQDTTPPVVTAVVSPAANPAGWRLGDVTVTGTGADSGSGVASCTTVTLSAEGAGQSAKVSCTDNAGNVGTAMATGINIDKTPPVTTATATPGSNANGWNKTDVSVALS